MRYLLLVCVLLASFAGAQEQPMQPDLPPEYRPPVLRDEDAGKALPASAATLAPDTVIMTIKGVCAAAPGKSSSDADCQTTITKAQFENLAEALLSKMKDSRKRQLANAYPGLLAMARAAEAHGVENSPRFQQRLAFARVQILSQEYIRQIDDEAAKLSDQELEDYYHSHTTQFQSVTLERIFIPDRKRLNPLPKDNATAENQKAEQKEAEEAMTQEAAELRRKAATGGDFLALQKEAYTAAGMTEVPPNPSLGTVHRYEIPAKHAAVFELKPGEVSEVLTDSTGHYIYKVMSKETEALADVKDEIHKMIANQRREEAIQAVEKPVTTEFNPAYFGPAKTNGGSPDSKPK
ncbi:MAG TPA: peptidylprolyl isomerase [Terriglobales bacterium]|nr:peptidylprolyl isomerase [Terriglobales bacterium]